MAITMSQIKAGSTSGGGGRGSSPNLQGSGAASDNNTAAVVKNSLANSQKVLTAMQSAQSQAAAAAKVAAGANPPPGVANGLKTGGLVPERSSLPLQADSAQSSLKVPSSWQGIQSLYETTSSSGSSVRTTVDIVQSPASQFAYLNWSTFNLGPNTTLNYLQNTSTLKPTAPVSAGQTVLPLSSVQGLFSGQSLIGDGISGGTTITQVNATAGTITLSRPLTQALSGDSFLGAALENSGTYVALNSVNGGSPSDLYGTLNASGQVYLLNQAGITLQAGSSVTAMGFTASTLPINANLVGSYSYSQSAGGYVSTTGSGIANNPDSQFLFSALPVTGNSQLKTFSFTPSILHPVGDVNVEKGATLVSTVDSGGSGGRVALIGANVVNEGTISTPKGQTILAAGLQVALTPHASTDTSLRGLDVAVGQIVDGTGAVTTVDGSAGSVQQNGLIDVPEGSAALVGASVSTGPGSVIDSLTTTALNGRIDIAALYNALPNSQYPNVGNALTYDNTGNTGPVTLGEGSLLRILPDWNDTSTKVVGNALTLNSLVSITGSSVEAGANSMLLAPGAVATAGALSMLGESLGNGVTLRAGSFFDNGNGIPQFLADSGEVSLDHGASIILTGSQQVSAPSSEYMLTLQLRGSELANSPLEQLNKNIRAKDLVIDTRYTGTLNGLSWVGTPLGDISGYLNLVTRNVSELTTAGGSLSIQAGHSVSLSSGTVMDVSGGSVIYSGGTFAPSQLITASGQIVPMYLAVPDQIYTGIVPNPLSVTQDPYLKGAAGGAIAISAPIVSMDGALRGVTSVGPLQIGSLTSVTLGAKPSLSSVTSLPTPSSLSITLSGQQVMNNQIAVVSAEQSQNVRFGDPASAIAGQLVLDPSLLSSGGFGNFSLINHDGSVDVPAGITLNPGPNGSVTLAGSTLRVDGSIIAPSGKINLSAVATPYTLIDTIFTLQQDQSFLNIVISGGQSYYQYGPVQQDGSVQAVGSDGSSVQTFEAGDYTLSPSGSLALGSHAVISTAGTLVNGRSAESASPILTSGGSISLSALNVTVPKGSVIDVSAGDYLSPTGKWNNGTGGSLTITAGRDSATPTIHDGVLALGGALIGYAAPGHQGGSLTLGAQAFQIGGSVSDQRVLFIDPQAFYGNGFSKLSLSSIGLEASYGAGDGTYATSLPGILVAPGTSIAPSVGSQMPVLAPSGSIALVKAPSSPLGTAPSLSLSVSGLSDPSLVNPLLILGFAEIAQGASILLNPTITSISGASVTASTGAFNLSAPTLVDAGSIVVPGGSISISSKASFPSNESLSASLITSDIQGTARLSTAGSILSLQDPNGLYGSIGTVLPGGSISLSGEFLTEAGSSLNVSGSSALLGVPGYQIGSATPISTIRVDSAGGAITLSGGDVFYMNGSMKGSAGGTTAAGGSLSVSCGSPDPVSTGLVVTQEAPDLSAAGLTGGGSGPEGSYLGSGVASEGYLGVNTFSGGGFSSVRLLGNVAFQGPVNLAVNGTLAVATTAPITRDPVTGYVNAPQQGGILSADSPVDLSARYISLGMAFAGALVTGDPFATKVYGALSAPPTSGSGELNVNAGQIDIGNLSLQNISTTSLSTSRGGTIRGDGSFVMSGDLSMSAGIVSPATGTSFMISAFPTDSSGEVGTLGSITVSRSGAALLPWSANGRLALYADSITQGGYLSAPLGTILLGRDASAVQVTDPISQEQVPATTTLTLTTGSATSVSAIDPVSGRSLVLPFGTSANGATWTDLAGNDITGSGIPSKGVTLDAANVVTAKGSVVDLRGGGELVASQWISGLGGTINYSADSSGNYAIVPGYNLATAPNVYDGGGPAVGTRIRLTGASGLAPGDYTLLPASYANLPGAYLLSPLKLTGALSPGGLVNPDGTEVVTGSVYNGFTSSPSPILQTFTLYSPSVLAKFEQVNLLNASPFFAGVNTSSRPQDGGRLLMSGTTSMNLSGGVLAAAGPGGTGAVVDIASAAAFLITGSSGPSLPATDGTIILDSSVLSAFNASSLLIGGTRSLSGGKTVITPLSTSVTVDSGADLKGQEFLLSAAPQSYTVTTSDTPENFASTFGVSVDDFLAANPSLSPGEQVAEGTVFEIPGAAVTINSGAIISASGNLPPKVLGIAGDGALVAVSGSSGMTLARTGFTPNIVDLQSATPVAQLSIGAGASLSGGTVILDSSSASNIDPSIKISATTTAVSSAAVSMGGNDSGMLSLSGDLLSTLNSSKNLSVTSYSTLLLHDGTGLGSSDMQKLSLHAAAISGDSDGGSVSVAVAPTGMITLDNSLSSKLPTDYVPAASSGSLSLSSSILNLGSGALRMDGFESVAASASTGVSVSGQGGLQIGGSLSLATPVVTAAGGASYAIASSGDLSLDPGSPSASSLAADGLGAKLSLTGASVSILSPVILPSGALSVASSSGDLLINAQLDLSGRTVGFNGHPDSTGGGNLHLASAANLTLDSLAKLDLSAPSGGGDAGSLSLSVPSGLLSLGGSIKSSAPAGASGSFSADLQSLGAVGFTQLENYLGNASGGFTTSQSIRVRSGGAVIGNVQASSFKLSTDSGDIAVNGTIDASGENGGSISLFSGGDLTVSSGALLNASGKTVNASGKGGSVDLESSAGWVTLSSGSTIDLSLATAPDPSLGQSFGSLMVTAPQTANGTGVQINPIQATIKGTPSLTAVATATFDAATPGTASIDPLPTWGNNLPTGLSYKPGEMVIAADGNVYQLTTDMNASDATSYQNYVSSEVAGGAGIDPSKSTYWTQVYTSWLNFSGTVTVGTKILDQPTDANGHPTGPALLYTAKEGAAIAAQAATDNGDSYAPSADPANWIIQPAPGNLQYLAQQNAALPMFNAGYASTLAGFAGPTIASQLSSLHLQPGEQLVNSLGGLVLSADWDLSTLRSGPVLSVLDGTGHVTGASIGSEPGVLTLRASGDLIFRGSLSDGFGNSINTTSASGGLYAAPLIPLLSDGTTVSSQRSWTYRIIAGSDIASADPLQTAAGSTAGITVGIPGQPQQVTTPGGGGSTYTVAIQSGQYQVIRTGTGDISLAAAGDVTLLSPLSSIYTAGTRAADPTLGGTFDTPAPNLSGSSSVGLVGNQQPNGSYEAQFAWGGGNLLLKSGGDITRLKAVLDSTGNFQYNSDGSLLTSADSSLQMPSNWLYRRGSVDPQTGLFQQMSYNDGFAGNDVASTSWWVDYSNFFQDVGALGGGNVVLSAAGNVSNMDVSIPTNFRMAARDSSGNLLLASQAPSVELGGGDMNVTAGGNIDGGVYYVERGKGVLAAGGSIITNPTRDPAIPSLNGYHQSDSAAWLPTTLYLGKGDFNVSAGGSVRLGPVANVFLTPPGINNSFWYKTYFSTYAPTDAVKVQALSGNLTVATEGATYQSPYAQSLLQLWFQQQLPAVNANTPTAAYFEPWLNTAEINNVPSLGTVEALMPPTLEATAFAGGITLQGNLTLSPSSTGDLSLRASQGVNGLASAGVYNNGTADTPVWITSTVNLSDAPTALLPVASSPLAFRSTLAASDQSSLTANGTTTGAYYITDGVGALFQESGSFAGTDSLLSHKLTLHDPGILHSGDSVPLVIDAAGGDITGITLFSPKFSQINAADNMTDIGLYIQNVTASDISTVTAGGNITLYDPSSALRNNLISYSAIAGVNISQAAVPSGDVQVSGPGTLELLAGGTIDLGNAPQGPNAPGLNIIDPTVWNGITSIGNSRNPTLPFTGADLVISAGVSLQGGLTGGGIDPAKVFSTAAALSGSDALYGELVAATASSSGQTSLSTALQNDGSFTGLQNDSSLDSETKALLSLRLFYLAIRDSGRNHSKPESNDHSYAEARAFIAALLDSGSLSHGDITAWQRNIATQNGGDLSLLVPQGGISLSSISTGSAGTPPGIITKHGGSIDIYTSGDISLGIGRIFTLRGGNIMIWSDQGNIAAGSSAKTVASAPPASILIDPGSADVQNDLAGLSTGGGIGVLATVAGLAPGDVDLYAPAGVIDAGDAGIRSSGNLNLGAQKILNADNIAVSGVSVGAPPPAPAAAAAAPAAAPAAAAPPAAASTAAAANNNAAQNAGGDKNAAQTDETPSLYSIDILGYGGGDEEDEDSRRKAASAGGYPSQASL
jgi:filamentous hemagglutinin family protein